jgi:hypothetical protein
VSSARQKKDETIALQTAALRAHAGQLRVELPEQWVCSKTKDTRARPWCDQWQHDGLHGRAS